MRWPHVLPKVSPLTHITSNPKVVSLLTLPSTLRLNSAVGDIGEQSGRVLNGIKTRQGSNNKPSASVVPPGTVVATVGPIRSLTRPQKMTTCDGAAASARMKRWEQLGAIRYGHHTYINTIVMSRSRSDAGNGDTIPNNYAISSSMWELQRY
jgi:hypothetical protein